MTAFIAVAAVFLVAAAVLCCGAWENSAVRLNRITIKDRRVPVQFDGFRIAHISDLHNAAFGHGQERLLALTAECAPDVIAITGDLIDKRRPGTENALAFVSRAAAIAPVYYVTGNHEAVSKEYPALRAALEACGVIVLDGRFVQLTRGGACLTLAGIDDPAFSSPHPSRNAQIVSEKLAPLIGKGEYTVLLSHRPELFAAYRAAGVDLALCGHAHGGQFRLPWGQGVIAPNQGLFPKYFQNAYFEEGKCMVVSRGLGNSSVPIRLHNRPEVVAVTLRASLEETTE